MKITSACVLSLLIILSFSSFGQVAVEEAAEDYATEMVPSEMIPKDLSFGNESDPNFVKFITPSGSIIIYFPEVLLVDEGDAHSVHFPLFGVAPVIPDYLDITVEEVFRRGTLGSMMTLSLLFDEEGNYNFLRDHLSISLFECNEDFSSDYRRAIVSTDLSIMTHTLDKSGNDYKLDFNSILEYDDAYQLVLHVEARPSPLVVKDEETNDPYNVFFFPEVGLMAYQKASYAFSATEDFVPLPAGSDTRSGYFDPESYDIYEFESLSEEDITFNIYRVKSWEGESRYDQVILAPIEDADPDISRMTLTEDMLQKTIEGTKIYTINEPSLILDYNDLSEALQYCTYAPKYEVPERIIGRNELPASQSLSVNPNNFRSFKLINNRLEGLSFTVEGNTITEKKSNIKDLLVKAKYQEMKDKAGKNAQKLFDFTYDVFTNWRDIQEKSLDWWKGKAKELNVKNIDGDNPQAYAEGIMKYYYGEDDDIAEMIVYQEQLKREGEKEPDDLFGTTGDANYSDRFWIDMTVNQQGNLVKSTHHRPGSNGDIMISFNYEGDQMTVGLVDEEDESFERKLAGMEGLIDYTFVLAALPAMNLKSGYQNELYLTNYEGSVFGGDHSIKPVFNKVAIEVLGEEAIDFLNEQVSTYKVQLKFMDRPDNPTVSIEGMYSPEESDGYYLNVWISKKDNLPLRLQTGGGSYWLFREGEDINKWNEWLVNHNPDPFGL